MKKYAIAYLILFLILWGLGLTHGIPFGITVFKSDWSLAFYPEITWEIVLIYNIIIMLACFVMAVILAKQKENVSICKWLVPVIIFIWFVFLPVWMTERVRYAPTEHTKEFWSIISLITGEHILITQ